MPYILIFWWSMYDNAMQTRSSVYAYTFTSLSDCRELGEKWLRERKAGEIQTRYAYSCEPGNTWHEVQS